MNGGIGGALGISEERCAELVAANWSRWVGLVPALARVPMPCSLEGWLAGVPRPQSDAVLVGLAQLADPAGLDDHDAAYVLAWVLHAGADSLIARYRDMSRDIDHHVASLLWIEIRTFPWRTKHWLAANIKLNVQRRLLLEFGRAKQLDNHNRTLLFTDLVPPEEFSRLPVTTEESPREELECFLDEACARRRITDLERRLLLDFVDAAHLTPRSGPRSSSRLFGDACSDLVGRKWGMSGRKARRLAREALDALTAATSEAA